MCLGSAPVYFVWLTSALSYIIHHTSPFFFINSHSHQKVGIFLFKHSLIFNFHNVLKLQSVSYCVCYVKYFNLNKKKLFTKSFLIFIKKHYHSEAVEKEMWTPGTPRALTQLTWMTCLTPPPTELLQVTLKMNHSGHSGGMLYFERTWVVLPWGVSLFLPGQWLCVSSNADKVQEVVWRCFPWQLRRCLKHLPERWQTY